MLDSLLEGTIVNANPDGSITVNFTAATAGLIAGMLGLPASQLSELISATAATEVAQVADAGSDAVDVAAVDAVTTEAVAEVAPALSMLGADTYTGRHDLGETAPARPVVGDTAPALTLVPPLDTGTPGVEAAPVDTAPPSGTPVE